MVLLFELMVVNQWHVLSRGFADATQTDWSHVYFVAFHIICVIITLKYIKMIFEIILIPVPLMYLFFKYLHSFYNRSIST